MKVRNLVFFLGLVVATPAFAGAAQMLEVFQAMAKKFPSAVRSWGADSMSPAGNWQQVAPMLSTELKLSNGVSEIVGKGNLIFPSYRWPQGSMSSSSGFHNYMIHAGPKTSNSAEFIVGELKTSGDLAETESFTSRVRFFIGKDGKLERSMEEYNIGVVKHGNKMKSDEITVVSNQKAVVKGRDIELSVNMEKKGGGLSTTRLKAALKENETLLNMELDQGSVLAGTHAFIMTLKNAEGVVVQRTLHLRPNFQSYTMDVANKEEVVLKGERLHAFMDKMKLHSLNTARSSESSVNRGGSVSLPGGAT